MTAISRPMIGATVMMTALLLLSCSTAPPQGSLERLKHDQRLTLMMDCRHEPERFGFPYSRKEYVQWRWDIGRWMPNMQSYCASVARMLVK